MNTTDKIMALADAYASQAKMVGLASPLKTRDVLRAEIEALVRDAERYRYMRNLAIEKTGMPGQPCIAMPNGMKSGYYLTEETADFAIDAAMQEKQS